MNAAADAITPPSTNAQDTLNSAIARLGREGVFHGYQRRMIRLSHENELVVVEKSRRIGATWAFAGDDAITAATSRGQGGDDILYISYSHDMAREYIEACAAFAKAFMGVDASVAEYMFDDEDHARPGESRAIKAFRIDFASGFSIQALSSRPRSLRGKQGKVRIDEAAFVDDLAELLKAAMALVMLGGSVVVLSTHNGTASEFNKLINEIRAGDREGKVIRITFEDAVADGLYERVAISKGEVPTPEGQLAWVAKIRKLYGDAASEELDVIPSRGSGSWLTRDWIEAAEDPAVPILRLSRPPEFTLLPDHIRQADITEWCVANVLPLILALNAKEKVAIGGDFARVSDLSVIWPLVETPSKALRSLFVLEMRAIPYTEQEFVWKFILSRLRQWRTAIDAQGNGGYLAERLVQAFGEVRVLAVKSTQANWWLENGPPVRQRFEDQGRLTVPRDADITSDLMAVKVRNGAPSVPTQRAKDGSDSASKRHADAAVALVMAIHAYRQGISGSIDFQSSSSQTGGGSRDVIDRGFGVVGSDLALEGF